MIHAITDAGWDALLPCPFCGEPGQVFPDDVGSGGADVPPYHAVCPECRVGFTDDDPPLAIAEWNRRVLPPSAADRIERLEAALKPFAFMDEEYDDLGDEVRLESINLATGEHLGGIPVSAFRRARAALTGDSS